MILTFQGRKCANNNETGTKDNTKDMETMCTSIKNKLQFNCTPPPPLTRATPLLEQQQVPFLSNLGTLVLLSPGGGYVIWVGDSTYLGVMRGFGTQLGGGIEVRNLPQFYRNFSVMPLFKKFNFPLRKNLSLPLLSLGTLYVSVFSSVLHVVCVAGRFSVFVFPQCRPLLGTVILARAKGQ